MRHSHDDCISELCWQLNGLIFALPLHAKQLRNPTVEFPQVPAGFANAGHQCNLQRYPSYLRTPYVAW